MAVRVLIVSPDTGFGGLIQQTLERSEEYEPVLVSTGRQALELAKQVPVDLAILDEDTADLKVGELGPVMQAINSEMRIVLIPADEPDRLKKSAGMQINGYRTKPFYLPDLVVPAEIPEVIKKQIKRADALSAWLEAVQIAGFSKPEANTLFGKPVLKDLPNRILRPHAPLVVKGQFLELFSDLS